jgi:hypothetical protein
MSPLFDLAHLEMFDSFLTALRTARQPVAKLAEALAFWVRNDRNLPDAVLPEPRAIWKLESLLLLVRIARAVDADDMVLRWRDAIAGSLHRIIRKGSVSVSGSRPSLIYTVLAAEVVDAANLRSSIPLEPMLDSVSAQLEAWLTGRQGSSAEAVAAACKLLAAHGRELPERDRIRTRSMYAMEQLLSGPIHREALATIVAYVSLLGDATVTGRLRTLVRSRLWETLQLNPGNDVPLLVDSYLAGVAVGETDRGRLAIAESTIAASANRLAGELTAACRT